MFKRSPGRRIAVGNTSDVYEWGPRSVVKVLRRGIPRPWAEREAATTELVRAAGLPAPRVEDEVQVGDRPGIVFERIEGPSMWERMNAEPAEIDDLSRLLAELQREIHLTAAPTGLPSLHERLRSNIARASLLTERETVEANRLLVALPKASSLCHFDMHPNNVLLADDGPVVVDWFDAACGDAAADVARSSVLMRSHAFQTQLGSGDPRTVQRFHDTYVRWVATTHGLNRDAPLLWEPAVLAGRLAEPLDEDMLAATLRTFRQPRDKSALAQALRKAPLRSNAG